MTSDYFNRAVQWQYMSLSGVVRPDDKDWKGSSLTGADFSQPPVEGSWDRLSSGLVDGCQLRYWDWPARGGVVSKHILTTRFPPPCSRKT